MRQALAMNDIPFAPLLGEFPATGVMVRPKLADTIPPVEPPAAPLATKRPAEHKLVAWRHADYRLHVARYATREAADAAVADLHYALYYKFAIMCGRDMVACGAIQDTGE